MIIICEARTKVMGKIVSRFVILDDNYEEIFSSEDIEDIIHEIMDSLLERERNYKISGKIYVGSGRCFALNSGIVKDIEKSILVQDYKENGMSYGDLFPDD